MPTKKTTKKKSVKKVAAKKVVKEEVRPYKVSYRELVGSERTGSISTKIFDNKKDAVKFAGETDGKIE